MNIKLEVEKHLEGTNAVVIEIYKTGSQLFIDSPHDLDYVVICSNLDGRIKQLKIEEYDMFIMSTEFFQDALHFNLDGDTATLFNYFSPLKEVIYGEYEHNWNMLEYELEYKQYLKTFPTKLLKWPKMLVHPYIILKMYENQSTEITSDMLKDIKLLYTNSEESNDLKKQILEMIANG